MSDAARDSDYTLGDGSACSIHVLGDDSFSSCARFTQPLRKPWVSGNLLPALAHVIIQTSYEIDSI